MRIGTGYDVHILTEGRKLIIGGVDIRHTKKDSWDIVMPMFLSML